MKILPESSNLSFIGIQVRHMAILSTCKRSKCGAVIVNELGFVLAKGYNSMPCHAITDCFKDSLAPTFKSDRTCCVHAEQRAIIDILTKNYPLDNTSLFFLRIDENCNPLYSGEPYCSICSKLALDVGITNFVLYKPEGWTSYTTEEYNTLTFQYK